MHCRSFTTAFVLIAAFAAADARPAGAQSIDDLFDRNTLQEVRLFINSRDLRQLRERFDENTIYPADLLWRDIRVRNVAVRSRGTGSRNPIKLGLLVDFGYYTTGQTLLGLRTLVLDNIWQDHSMLREHIAMALFARMGEPASRESYARLYINNAFQGVYALVENVDTSYLSRTLGEEDGYLFEYHWMSVFYGDDLGDELEPYRLRFEPRTREEEADAVLWGPIRELFREVNSPVDAVWRNRVEQYVDLRQFVKFIAIEIFLSEGDGVTGYAGMNNFYLYRQQGTDQHRWIVWDRDFCMLQADSPIFLRTDENVLFRGAMAFSDLRTLYLDTLEQCALLAMEDGWFETEARRASSLIAGAAHEDTRKDTDNDRYDAETEFVINFTQVRPMSVLQQVEAARLSFPGAPAAELQEQR